MKIVSDTPFRLAPIPSRLNFPGHSLSLVVKGTFDLVPGGVMTPAAEQPFPTGDVPYPGDENHAGPQTGAPRYPSDFAPTKPGADLMLVGHCHVPGGVPTAACRVTFAVGPHSRSLVVMGERQWKLGLLGRTPTDPEPFTSMELRYERAYGGRGDKLNPVGAGGSRQEDESGQRTRKVPNIHFPPDEPEPKAGGPAGFGPVGAMWPFRKKKLGTFNKRWLKTRWPAYPEDLDPTFFNAAPPSMQPGVYLRGDEEVLLRHLDKELPELRSRLPGLRVRCFLNYDPPQPPVPTPAPSTNGAPAHAPDPAASRPSDDYARLHGRFLEVSLNLDTLWIDADERKAVLLWRGSSEVRDEAFEEVRHAFIMTEPLAQPPASLEACRERFLALTAPPAAEPEQAEEEPKESPPPDEADPAAQDAAAAAALAQERAELEQMLIDQGVDPQTRQTVLGLLDKPPEEIAATLQNMVKRDMAAAGLDPAKPIKLTPAQEQARLQIMKGWGWPDDMIALALAAEQDADKAAAEQEARERAKAEEASAAEAAQQPPPGALTRPQVEELLDAGEPLDGKDMHGADLSGLDFTGVSMREADLTKANLSGATLDRADLTDATLVRADLTKASLREASAPGASFGEAKMPDADLSGADLAGCTLRAAILTRAALIGANLEAADLTGADLRHASAEGAVLAKTTMGRAVLTGARLARADFTDAVLTGADLGGVDASGATFAGVRAPGLNMRGATLEGFRASNAADLSGARFREASAAGSFWESAVITRADFRGAMLEGANFTKAHAEEADFSYAMMRGAKFPRARLRGAQLFSADLFEGSLEKADLTSADLRRSNLYGVEFLDATLAQTAVGGANLKMTKLADQAVAER